MDNIFPHHEAEIAQSECCTGEKFVRTWLHCAHLMVEGQKMSKSLGNFYTIRDLLAKGWTGREVRYALLTVNYRLPLNFTMEGLAGARAALKRIDEWVERLTDLSKKKRDATSHHVAFDEFSGKQVEWFLAALDDDLNISGAMGHLFDLIRDSNAAMDRDQIAFADAESLLEQWRRLDRIVEVEREPTSTPAEVLALAGQRQEARAAKDWAESDRLRDAIAKLGWNVKDTKDGPKLTPG